MLNYQQHQQKQALCVLWLTSLLHFSHGSSSIVTAKWPDWRNGFISIITARQSPGGVCATSAFGEFVPNPSDCKLFYLCMENGEAVTASCPPTMLFNPITKLCDTADNVRCELATTTTVDTPLAPQTTPQPTPMPSAPTSNGEEPAANELNDATRYCAALELQANFNQLSFIGSAVNCQHYYICYYGQAILQVCSANLHWNGNIGKCDLPENAKCELPNNNQIINWPQSSDNGNNQPDNGGWDDRPSHMPQNIGDLIHCPAYGRHLFPHMERCEFFIYCVKGNAILQRCPFYYHFDIVSKRCKMRPAAICVRQLNIEF